jgi:DNA polymerase-3 subunit gamma/tau
MTLIRMATLAPSQEISKLISHIERLEKRLASSTPLKPQGSQQVIAQSAPAPPTQPPQAETETRPPKKPEAPVASAAVNRGWQGLVDQVKQSRPMLGSVLEHGRLIKLELPLLEVGYTKGSFMISQLQELEISQDLESIAAEFFGQPVKLRVTPLESNEQETPPSLVEVRQTEETDRMRRLKDDAMDHPALKSVQEIFSGSKIKKVIPIDKGFV